MDAIPTLAPPGDQVAVQTLRLGVVAGVHLDLRQEPEAREVCRRDLERAPDGLARTVELAAKLLRLCKVVEGVPRGEQGERALEGGYGLRVPSHAIQDHREGLPGGAVAGSGGGPRAYPIEGLVVVPPVERLPRLELQHPRVIRRKLPSAFCQR